MASWRRWACIAALAFVTTQLTQGLVVRRAYAWCRLTTVDRRSTCPAACVTEGLPLAWRKRCTAIAFFNTPPTLGDAAVRAAFGRSFSRWTTVECDGERPGLEVTQIAQPSMCKLSEHNSRAGNISSVAFLDPSEWEAQLYSPSAYAVTTVWNNQRTGEIVDGDMEINLGNGPYAVCDETAGCELGTVDLENVVTHEAGHYFGLAHSDEPDATMYCATRVRGELAKRTLEEDDRAGLCAAYPPGTLGAACDPTPAGGLSYECGGDPESCACSTLVGARQVAHHAATSTSETKSPSTWLALGLMGWLTISRQRRRRAPLAR